MKKISTILMALMVLCLTQCKPAPEGGDDNNGNVSGKVKVRCEIPTNNGMRSDFTNLIDEGRINWSHGRECVYVAIHGANPQIIELESWAEGNPPVLEFTGEAAEGLIEEGEEYDVWYFGHSQQLDVPYVNMVGNNKIEGSIANQSGRLDDLGYCHIAMTRVKAEMEDGVVKLNLVAVLKTQIAIALLDLEKVTELYGDAIVGTEYSLEYNEGADRYVLNVVEDAEAKISVESASGISYVVLLPNDNKESVIKSVQDSKVYGYTFRNYIKSPKVYCRIASDDKTVEALPWTFLYEGIENGHYWVDLGLPSGLKWATCNVGATSPEEYGDYFAWGETSTKENFSDCPTVGLSISELQSQGYIDSEGNLTSQYDAATANWGGTWRMPTKEEQEELLNNCTWTWMTQNGVNGYKVEGQNDNSIFLPAAGHRDGSVLDYAGGIGSYWSSTPIESYGDAYYLYFDSSDHDMEYDFRYYGHSVRPVLE